MFTLGSAKIKEEYDAKRKNPSSVASTPYSKGADSDDEGSIIRSVGKNFSCGACRTKESHVWWKAPRGLSSNVLCDNCGLSWRKYADLNHMRPVREEVLAKTKTAEKREGTPLNAPSNKRLKVRFLSERERALSMSARVDDRVCRNKSNTCSPFGATDALCGMSQERTCRQGHQVPAVPDEDPRRGLWLCPRRQYYRLDL